MFKCQTAKNRNYEQLVYCLNTNFQILSTSSNGCTYLPVSFIFSSSFQKKLEETPFLQFLLFFPKEIYFFWKFPSPIDEQTPVSVRQW